MNAKAVLIVAVLMPLVPAAEWVASGVRDFGAMGVGGAPLSLTLLYFPARILALVGFVLMFYQFLLSARLPWLVALYKQPNLIKYHRTLGQVGFLLMLLHGLMMLATDLLDYGRILHTTGKLLGITALFLLGVAVIAAWWLKPLQFSLKTWKRFHILAYFVFPLAFLHAITIGSVAGQWTATRIVFSGFFVVYLYVAGRKLATLRAVGRKKDAPGVETRG